MPRHKMDKDEILNQVKVTCMTYGLKAMANDLDKPYSTLSNELDHRDFAKLGLLTTLSILENSHASYAPAASRDAAIRALDLIEAALGRLAVRIPDPSDKPAPQTMRLMSAMSKEFSESMHALADAIDDGEFTPGEIAKCLAENRDLIRICLQIEHHLNAIQPVRAVIATAPTKRQSDKK